MKNVQITETIYSNILPFLLNYLSDSVTIPSFCSPSQPFPVPLRIHRNQLKPYTMKKYLCTVCNYIYDPILGDPDSGIAPGTPFEELPDDWVCPLCGVGKEDFEPVEE